MTYLLKELTLHTGGFFKKKSIQGCILFFSGERRKPLSELLEPPASDNGADMYKYNTLYTHKSDRHVLTPESCYTTDKK